MLFSLLLTYKLVYHTTSDSLNTLESEFNLSSFGCVSLKSDSKADGTFDNTEFHHLFLHPCWTMKNSSQNCVPDGHFTWPLRDMTCPRK